MIKNPQCRIFVPILSLCFSLIWGLGFARYIIEDLSVGGYGTVQVKPVVDARLQKEPPFEFAFVLAGMNDALYLEYSHVPVATYEVYLKSILQALLNAGVTTYVAETIPVIDEYLLERHPELTESPNLIIDEYNLALHRVAEATMPPTPVIPLHALFEPHVNYDVDAWIQNPANSNSRNGNHPTNVGACQIALAFRQTIEVSMVTDRRVVLFGDSIMNGAGLKPGESPAAVLERLLNVNGAADWMLYP